MDVSVAAGAAPNLPKLAGRDRPLDSPCGKPHAEVTIASSETKVTPFPYFTRLYAWPSSSSGFGFSMFSLQYRFQIGARAGVAPIVVILEAAAQVFSKDAQLMHEDSCHLCRWLHNNSSGQMNAHSSQIVDLQIPSSFPRGLGSHS